MSEKTAFITDLPVLITDFTNDLLIHLNNPNYLWISNFLVNFSESDIETQKNLFKDLNNNKNFENLLINNENLEKNYKKILNIINNKK